MYIRSRESWRLLGNLAHALYQPHPLRLRDKLNCQLQTSFVFLKTRPLIILKLFANFCLKKLKLKKKTYPVVSKAFGQFYFLLC